MILPIEKPQKPLKDTENSGYDKLQDEIDRIDKDYADRPTQGIQIPEIPSPDVNYKEYDAPTDEDLGSLAQSTLTDYYENSRADIDKTAKDKTGTLDSYREGLIAAFEKDSEEAKRAYDEARRNSSDSALKRGLARSSIAQLGQDSLNAEEAKQAVGLGSGLNDKLAGIDRDIASAEADREAALRSFDLKYAAKLTTTLNELKSEREKKQAEVLEYNNALAQKLTQLAMDQAGWKQDYESGEIDLESKREEYAKAEKEKQTAERNRAALGAVKTYLGKMDAKAAYKELTTNPYYAKVLDGYSYTSLCNELSKQMYFKS